MENTQLYKDKPPNSRATVGIAVAMMVWSKVLISMPNIKPTSTNVTFVF
jgi:hypothetical protein